MEARRRHKLIEGVTKYGKKWVAIATLVPGRTNLQCQNRWTRGLDLATEKTAGRWKPKVDVRLIKAVKKHG